MMAGTEVQSREGPCSISATNGMRNANIGCVWEHGPAHGAIVAVTPAIISRKSEGSLGSVAMEGVECPVIAREGYNTLERAEPHRHGEARIKPQGKGASDDDTRSLEPDWGNPAVRVLRGGEGNLTILAPESDNSSKRLLY